MAEIRLELWVLDALTDLVGVSRQVPPYTLPYIGETVGERAAHRERAVEWLADRRYASGRTVAEGLADLLQVWARPDVLITMDASEFDPYASHLYRCGWSGRVGFTSYQEGDVIVLEDLRSAQVPDAMASMVAPLPPFSGNSAVVISNDPHASAELADVGVSDSSRRARTERGDVEVYFRHAYHRLGLVTVNTVRRRGQAPQRLDTLSWADTDNGRFAITSEPAGDGLVRRTFQPTDGALIAWWIRDRTS